MLPASDRGTGRLPSVRGSSPDYRRQIVDTRAKLAELPDLYKLVAFDRNRRAMVTMAENVEKATRPPIPNEAMNGLSNRRGTIAMARTARVRSATSQFYINVADNPRLDNHGYAPDDFGYAVFGRVTAGMDVVDKIATVRTEVKGDMENVPVTPVVIRHVTVQQ